MKLKNLIIKSRDKKQINRKKSLAQIIAKIDNDTICDSHSQNIYTHELFNQIPLTEITINKIFRNKLLDKYPSVCLNILYEYHKVNIVSPELAGKITEQIQWWKDWYVGRRKN